MIEAQSIKLQIKRACATALLVGFIVQPAIGKNEEPVKTPPVPVKTVQVVRKDVPVQLAAVGTVVPLQSVEVRPRIDSQVMAVKFKAGDVVRAGDVLFVLDDRTLKAQAGLAKANVVRDQAQELNLRRTMERDKTLVNQNAISKQAYEDSQTTHDVAAATLMADQAALENIDVQVGYATVTAPISGATGTINFTVGNNVAANDTLPMVVINQVQPIWVQASLAQDRLDALRKAMAAGDVPSFARRDTGKDVSRGSFSYIDNAINQASGTFAGRAVFGNDDGALWPGMLVNLTIQIGQDKDAMVVPEQAVQTGPAGSFVFVDDNGAAKKIPVRVWRIQAGEAVIASGLSGTEKIITDGLMSLTDGSKIKDGHQQSPQASQPDAKR